MLDELELVVVIRRFQSVTVSTVVEWENMSIDCRFDWCRHGRGRLGMVGEERRRGLTWRGI